MIRRKLTESSKACCSQAAFNSFSNSILSRFICYICRTDWTFFFSRVLLVLSVLAMIRHKVREPRDEERPERQPGYPGKQCRTVCLKACSNEEQYVHELPSTSKSWLSEPWYIAPIDILKLFKAVQTRNKIWLFVLLRWLISNIDRDRLWT